MGEMVERVISAIAGHLQGAIWTGIDDDLTSVIVDGVVDLPDLARAMIAAIRVPTEAMVTAGRQQIPENGPDRDDMVDAWQAMIDAALAE